MRTEPEQTVDHRSFRDQIAFSIGFAVSRSRELLRRLIREHAPDDARRMLAQRVVEHLGASGFEIDEERSGAQEAPIGLIAPDACRVGAGNRHVDVPAGVAIGREAA